MAGTQRRSTMSQPGFPKPTPAGRKTLAIVITMLLKLHFKMMAGNLISKAGAWLFPRPRRAALGLVAYKRDILIWTRFKNPIQNQFELGPSEPSLPFSLLALQAVSWLCLPDRKHLDQNGGLQAAQSKLWKRNKQKSVWVGAFWAFIAVCFGSLPLAAWQKHFLGRKHNASNGSGKTPRGPFAGLSRNSWECTTWQRLRKSKWVLRESACCQSFSLAIRAHSMPFQQTTNSNWLMTCHHTDIILGLPSKEAEVSQAFAGAEWQKKWDENMAQRSVDWKLKNILQISKAAKLSTHQSIIVAHDMSRSIFCTQPWICYPEWAEGLNFNFLKHNNINHLILQLVTSISLPSFYGN